MSAITDDFLWRVRRADDRVVVELVGELDISRAPELQNVLLELVEREGNRHLAIDLGELSYIDSTGLAALVVAHRQLEAIGGDMVLWNPRPSAQKTLEMTGLVTLFEITAEPSVSLDPS